MFDPSILQVLKTLQKEKPSFIVGGYLRDHLAGIEPYDVDIATELSIEEVKKHFPQLNGTEKGLAFGIGRFKKKDKMFEISTHPNDSIIETMKERDFTINGLYSDGETMVDLFGSRNDIEAKIIRPLESPVIHFSKKPEAYLRAIRLSAHLGFDLSTDLILFMHQNKDFFHQSTLNRLQQEGHRILQSTYPFKAIYHLQELRFLKGKNTFDTSIKVPVLSEQFDVRLAYIASVIGVDLLYDFLDLFQLSKRLKEKIHYLSPYFDDHKKIDNPYLLNEIILLKRYQYHQEPHKLKEYLQHIKR